MNHLPPIARAALLVLSFGLLPACNDATFSTSATGRLTLGISDAPVDRAEHVYVQFSGLELQAASGQRISIDYVDDSEPPQALTKTLDLLALQGGLREFLLEQRVLPAGVYSWVRLKVNAEADGLYDSYIVIDDAQYELHIPSGAQNGLKLNRAFEVPVNAELDLSIDFDLRKSVHRPEGIHFDEVPVYYLRPTLRMVSTAQAGYLYGSLNIAVFNALNCSLQGGGYVVYIYSGSGITADDIDGDSGDPVTTARLIDEGGGNYHYRSALLAPGEYSVAATCNADQDDPLDDDPIAFIGAGSATVLAGSGTLVNF